MRQSTTHARKKNGNFGTDKKFQDEWSPPYDWRAPSNGECDFMEVREKKNKIAHSAVV